MANTKISALTSATTPLAGTETLPIVQSSATTKVTVSDLTAGRSVSGANFVVSSSTIPVNGVYLPTANSVGIATNSTLRTTFNASGSVGIGTTSLTGYNLRVSKIITGSATSYGIVNDGVTQSDVTTFSYAYYNAFSTLSAAFTMTVSGHFVAQQGTVGSGSIVTNQFGFYSLASLTGATLNCGFYGNIPAPTSGIATTGTITSISSSTTTVTVNHNAITYTNGQVVTISATANATALVSGATCTILTIGTTDFTLIGAASNTVGVSFTASGAGTGTGTVTLNVQGSGKTVAGAASGSFTYTTTTSQTFAAVTVLTGSVTVSTRYNLYMNGTADNYIAGNLGIGVTSPATKIDVLGTIQAATAATQDAVRLAGRAGGTGTFAVTLTPTTLTASRTLTLPDATTTVVGTDATQTLTNKTLDSGIFTGTFTAGGGVGTSGQFLQSTGTGIQWAAATGVLAKSTSVFTSATAATYTAPANTQWVKITVVGSGGNGGGILSQRGSGGGGGGVAIKWLAMTAGQTLIYTVGLAVTSTVVSGTLTITTISAGSGSAGSSTAYAANAQGGGAGGAASGGDKNINGGTGGTSYGSSTAVATQVSGVGGNCPGFGSGGTNTAAAISNGGNGIGYGAGGGGSIGNTSVGLGTSGVIIFEAF